jgi:hypothetical protein
MVFSLSAPWLERQELGVHVPDFTESTAALAESQLRTAVLGAPGAVPGLGEAVQIERVRHVELDGMVSLIKWQDVVIDELKSVKEEIKEAQAQGATVKTMLVVNPNCLVVVLNRDENRPWVDARFGTGDEGSDEAIHAEGIESDENGLISRMSMSRLVGTLNLINSAELTLKVADGDQLPLPPEGGGVENIEGQEDDPDSEEVEGQEGKTKTLIN